ncbi:50S ribosomal protein L1 [Candidatus Gracilibacteria bacterium]|nr:50S ribosomal protein L1 [Candidatus Gracilibacteria bacterium]
MAKHGKKYNEASKLIVKEMYSLEEAVALVKQTSTMKGDATCELHMALGLDPRQAEQNIRTTVSLPGGTGKTLRVAAFVGEENVKAAKEAGAVEAGTTELIEKIEKGWLGFDIAVATPDQMKELGKIAKVLGQKKLMPNPKSGTVTPDFAGAIKELQGGKIELRVDKTGILHTVFGKVSFDEAKLMENLKTIIAKVKEIKPSTAKGTYMKSITLCTTMGPGVKVDTKGV